ncbi:MAG: prolipoprotein diacylglyceryl transferase [Kiritimatiellae bacterium]|nr:prolipoprotein diacylglyceryl transferase [Kiritimatiellia bacterium]
MHPDLIPGLPVKTYGFCMALGFLAAWQVLAWLCRRTGRKPEPLSNLLMLMLFSGIVGARIEYVREFWDREFASDPLSVFKVWQGGLVFYGGLILAIAVFLVWCRVRRERVAPVADAFVTIIPLAHAFGRVGCFFYGCCYGRLSQSAFAVAFPRLSPAWSAQCGAKLIPESAPASLPVLPTQLFEAAAVFCLFVVLLFVFLDNWRKRPGFTTGCYLAGYACIRFGLEFLRDDLRQRFGTMSIGQVISIGLFVLGISFMLVSLLRSRAENCKIFGPTN